MKTFENPEIQVKSFAVEDIMTGSDTGNVSPDRNTGNMATPWN